MSLRHTLLLFNGLLSIYVSSCLLFSISPLDRSTIQTNSSQISNVCRATKGFESNGDNANILQLNKNLYGSHNAPLAWFKALKHSLESRGFKASNIDPCLFIHKHMIVLCFVNDLIYVGHDVVKIDAMIANLGTEFLHTVEEDITSFWVSKFRCFTTKPSS